MMMKGDGDDFGVHQQEQDPMIVNRGGHQNQQMMMKGDGDDSVVRRAGVLKNSTKDNEQLRLLPTDEPAENDLNGKGAVMVVPLKPPPPPPSDDNDKKKQQQEEEKEHRRNDNNDQQTVEIENLHQVTTEWSRNNNMQQQQQQNNDDDTSSGSSTGSIADSQYSLIDWDAFSGRDDEDPREMSLEMDFSDDEDDDDDDNQHKPGNSQIDNHDNHHHSGVIASETQNQKSWTRNRGRIYKYRILFANMPTDFRTSRYSWDDEDEHSSDLDSNGWPYSFMYASSVSEACENDWEEENEKEEVVVLLPPKKRGFFANFLHSIPSCWNLKKQT